MQRRSKRRNRGGLAVSRNTEHAAGYAALYVTRAMNAVDRTTHAAQQLWGWLEEFAEELTIQHIMGSEEEDPFRSRRRNAPPGPPAKAWAEMVQYMEAMADSIAEIRHSSRVFEVATEFSLDTAETNLLEFMCTYSSNHLVECLWDRALGGTHSRALMSDIRRLAYMADTDASSAAARLRPSAPLRRTGLLGMNRSGNLCTLSRLLRVVAEPPDSGSSTRDMLLGVPQKASLPLSAFDHIGPQVDHLKAVLAGALAEGAPGVQFMLYGAPGTGKTELSKTLAAELGVPIFAVGEADTEGDEPNRTERLGELRLALQLLAANKRAFILCDEAEDIFNTEDGGFAWNGRADGGMFSSRRTEYSRAYMHRLLEQAPVPIIFTANDLGRVNQATLRRISVCVEMQVPPVPVRARLWREAAEAEGVTVAEGDIREMASALPAAPAVARSAMRTARLAGGDAEMVRMTVQGVLRAMHKGRVPAGDSNVDIDIDLVNADIDLGALAERLAAPKAPRDVSLLLSGPPGSGKSAFVRHLAARMGMPVLQKRASDILNMYVGGTEQRIAAAFEEALQAEAFLIFDEADSLLASRESAHRGWEVSQVNEMLTWMERHPLPFAATTNLLDRVDSAAMRRFLIKATFGYLSAAQVAKAFSRFFGLDLPANAAGLDRLTPADFEVVRRGAALRGDLANAEALVHALRAEQAAKPGQTRSVGFMR